jgi:hypothetical protein
MMQLRISERKKAKIKMALQGSSGSGKDKFCPITSQRTNRR